MRDRLRSALDLAVIAAGIVLVGWRWGSSHELRRAVTAIDLRNTLAEPSAAHWLGTDSMGRDLAARLAVAVTDAVLPLWAAVLAATIAGIALALVVIVGGRLDDGRRRTRWTAAVDAGAAAVAGVPVGLAVFAWAAMRAETGLVPALGGIAAAVFVRAYLGMRDWHRHDQGLAWWTAHAALGGRPLARIWRYGLMGQWRASLAESTCQHLRVAVALEASLSYLGFGVAEPAPSLGNILAAHFDRLLKGQWWVPTLVGATLVLLAVWPGAVRRVAGRVGSWWGDSALIRQSNPRIWQRLAKRRT